MPRRSKKSLVKSRKSLLLAVAALILLAVGAVFALKNNSSPDSTVPTAAGGTSSANSKHQTYSTTPLNPSVNAPNEARKEGSSSQPTLTSPPPASSQKVTVILTGVATDSGAVKVRTLVNGTTTGSCQVTASRSGYSSITAKSSVTLSVNSYVCGDFGLKKSQFASGNWHFVVTLSSGGQSASDQIDRTL